MKLLAFMPRRLASAVIICANTSSLPAMASASVTQASLPDCTIMPLIRLSTVTGTFGSRNMREPSCFQPTCDTVSVCSSVRRFSFSALKVR
ncbi:hypothetical protein D3C85_1525230 [compost metagenome]